MKRSDRYMKIVTWSKEDHCYIGTCPGLMLGGVHGKDEAKVYQELCQAVAEWIKIHAADGVPLPPATAGKIFSGKFVLRTGKELHQELTLRALAERQSLNTYCVNILREPHPPSGSNPPRTSRSR